eukprot:1463721-Amphidinium_carterae.1
MHLRRRRQSAHGEDEKVIGSELIRGKRAVQMVYSGRKVRLAAWSVKEYVMPSVRFALRAS